MNRNFLLLATCLAIGPAVEVGCGPSSPEPADSAAAGNELAPAGTNRETGTTALPVAAGGQEMSSAAGTAVADDIPTDSDEPRTDRRRGGPARGDASTALISPPTADVPASGSAADVADRSADQDDPDAPVLTPPEKDDVAEPPTLNDGRDGAAKPGNAAAARPAEPGSADGSGPAKSPAAAPGAGSAAVDNGRSKPDGTPDSLADSGHRASGAGRPDSPAASSRPPSGLPEEYRSLDQNQDGQLGLYEWPRDDLAGFRRLDRDQDGFLVPGELADADNTKVAPPE